VVTSGERTERIGPILRRQKKKCTESHRTEENNASKYRREKEKLYGSIDFRGKNNRTLEERRKNVPNFGGQKGKCTEF
jgi:hypothetical protein